MNPRRVTALPGSPCRSHLVFNCCALLPQECLILWKPQSAPCLPQASTPVTELTQFGPKASAPPCRTASPSAAHGCCTAPPPSAVPCSVRPLPAQRPLPLVYQTLLAALCNLGSQLPLKLFLGRFDAARPPPGDGPAWCECAPLAATSSCLTAHPDDPSAAAAAVCCSARSFKVCMQFGSFDAASSPSAPHGSIPPSLLQAPGGDTAESGIVAAAAAAATPLVTRGP